MSDLDPAALAARVKQWDEWQAGFTGRPSIQGPRPYAGRHARPRCRTAEASGAPDCGCPPGFCVGWPSVQRAEDRVDLYLDYQPRHAKATP